MTEPRIYPEMFLCEETKCRLMPRACIMRQRKASKRDKRFVGSGPMDFLMCKDCEQGRGIAAAHDDEGKPRW